MTNVPETSESLIARVKDPANGEAWADFLDMYRPVILRMAKRRNLQDADAQDICQKVLFAGASPTEAIEAKSTRLTCPGMGRGARCSHGEAVGFAQKSENVGERRDDQSTRFFGSVWSGITLELFSTAIDICSRPISEYYTQASGRCHDRVAISFACLAHGRTLPCWISD